MKKITLFLLSFLLLIGVVFPNEDFEYKRLNLGNYEVDDLSIEVWNDFSVRISDSTDAVFLFHVLDEEVAFQTSRLLKKYLIENNLNSIEQLITFLEDNNLYYSYENFPETDKYYIDSQSFFEEILVPKFKLTSGYSNVLNDYMFSDWNSKIHDYDSCMTVTEESMIFYSGYNGDNYESKHIVYYAGDRAGDSVTLSKYDPDTYYYTLLEGENSIGDKWVLQGDGNHWNEETFYYSNGDVEKYTNYNDLLGEFDNKEYFDKDEGCTSYYTESKQFTKSTGESVVYFTNCKVVYDDYYYESKYSDWNSKKDYFDTKIVTSSDSKKHYAGEYSDYNTALEDYNNMTEKYSDRIVRFYTPDMWWHNIEVFDDENKLISYLHIIRPWDEETETRDIEIMSEGIIYKYTGLKVLDNDLYNFKLCQYKDSNGKKNKKMNENITKKELFKALLDFF